MTFYIHLIFLSISFIFIACGSHAQPLKQRPITNQIIKLFSQQSTLPGVCKKLLRPYYIKLASLEKYEVSFLTIDYNQSCRFELLGLGTASGVKSNKKVFLSSASQFPGQLFLKSHTHPLENTSYFSKPGAFYSDQIMFTSQKLIEYRSYIFGILSESGASQ